MLQKINIVYNIECGEKTCAIAPGKFCKYMRYEVFSGSPRCTLFGVDPLEEVDGWTQRCKDCLDGKTEIK